MAVTLPAMTDRFSPHRSPALGAAARTATPAAVGARAFADVKKTTKQLLI
jgi:hypothetical protein